MAVSRQKVRMSMMASRTVVAIQMLLGSSVTAVRGSEGIMLVRLSMQPRVQPTSTLATCADEVGKRDGKGCKVPGKLEKSLHPQVMLHNHHFCAPLQEPQQ